MRAATAVRAQLRVILTLPFSVAVLLLVAGNAEAQQVRVGVDSGPHYVGDAVSIRITASGFEAAPTPEVTVEPPARGQLDLLGMSPNVSQSISIINGRITRTRDVTHVFQYRFVGDRAGVAKLGPFRITQAGRDVPERREGRGCRSSGWRFGSG